MKLKSIYLMVQFVLGVALISTFWSAECLQRKVWASVGNSCVLIFLKEDRKPRSSSCHEAWFLLVASYQPVDEEFFLYGTDFCTVANHPNHRLKNLYLPQKDGLRKYQGIFSLTEISGLVLLLMESSERTPSSAVLHFSQDSCSSVKFKDQNTPLT